MNLLRAGGRSWEARAFVCVLLGISFATSPQAQDLIAVKAGLLKAKANFQAVTVQGTVTGSIVDQSESGRQSRTYTWHWAMSRGKMYVDNQEGRKLGWDGALTREKTPAGDVAGFVHGEPTHESLLPTNIAYKLHGPPSYIEDLHQWIADAVDQDGYQIISRLPDGQLLLKHWQRNPFPTSFRPDLVGGLATTLIKVDPRRDYLATWIKEDLRGPTRGESASFVRTASTRQVLSAQKIDNCWIATHVTETIELPLETSHADYTFSLKKDVPESIFTQIFTPGDIVKRPAPSGEGYAYFKVLNGGLLKEFDPKAGEKRAQIMWQVLEIVGLAVLIAFLASRFSKQGVGAKQTSNEL